MNDTENQNNQQLSTYYLKQEQGISLSTILVSIICCIAICLTSIFIYHKFNPKIVVNQTTLTYDSTLSSKSLTDTIASIKPCVVEVRCQVSGGVSSGSGVAYSKKQNLNVYQIITNYHVVQNATKIYVTLCDGSTTYTATFLGADVINDIAMIEITTSIIDESLLKVATLGDSSTLKVGETAIAIGNPLGQLGGTVTTGIISALDREITVDGEQMTLLQTNAQINKGNSGGGLFNELGHLVGIVNAKSSGTGIEGIGFAIPINTASESANQICTTYTPSNFGYIEGQVMFAQSYIEVNKDNYADYMFSTIYRDYGIYINSLYSGSDANNAGLKVGDYIYMIDDTMFTTIKQLNQFLKTKGIGDTLNIAVKRVVGNQWALMQFELTLTQFICQG